MTLRERRKYLEYVCRISLRYLRLERTTVSSAFTIDMATQKYTKTQVVSPCAGEGAIEKDVMLEIVKSSAYHLLASLVRGLLSADVYICLESVRFVDIGGERLLLSLLIAFGQYSSASS